MGRYNNKRTQRQAEELKNTPSRARFSNGPPRRKTNKNTKDINKKSDQSSGRVPKTAATARVIDKIQTRQQQNSRQQQIFATTEEALHHIDKSKFDKITLPGDVVEVIDTLLTDLGVKENEDTKNKKLKKDENLGDNGDVEEKLSTKASCQREQQHSTYSEYDDDVDEEAFEGIGARLGGITEKADWEEGLEETMDEEEVPDRVKTNKAFLYLTQRLSFSEHDASQACVAIESWHVHCDETSQNEAVAFAMDWLCLHCTERTLIDGFKPHKNHSNQSPLLTAPAKIKIVAHPSISVAKSITSDKEWSRNVRIQEATLKYVQLGFHHSDALEVCENIENYESLGKADNKTVLIQLLKILESTIVGDRSLGLTGQDNLNETDLMYAAEERAQELDVLQAIYDEQLEIFSSETNDVINHTYSLKITPVDDLQEPARSEDCRLQVFPRLGYPVAESPLLFFSNPSLPPSLLRRVNNEIARIATESIGVPIIFEIVNFLSESLCPYQQDFVKEQRRKEFEAEQMRIRKQGHGVVALASEVNMDGKVGRRQRAKLKAAEKAYDREEQIQKESIDFRQRQNERVRTAKEGNSRIRISMAEQTLAKREKDRIEEEAERVARAAMNKAFNCGKSVGEARKAAEKAKTESLTQNRAYESVSEVILLEGNDRTQAIQEPNELKPSPKSGEYAGRLTAMTKEYQAKATPTTTAFMDRLRQMYEDAAKLKAGEAPSDTTTDKDDRHRLNGYHLSKPVQDNVELDRHFPRPVAIPNGELGEIMNDILNQQKNQPWLISPQARCPTTISVENKIVSTNQTTRQRNISKSLRHELEQKRNAAEVWAQKNPALEDELPKKINGFTPQRFCSMMSAREKLPAFQIAKEIIATIKSNQITVIAGDTGCGKTTQVPQLILDDLILSGEGGGCNIIVTQPRRISAIGVSERIADERCERVGDTCGYSIKLEKKLSSRTRLLLCTTGILLRRLQVDPDVASVSHIFVDEVHERDLNTDFLLIILKDLLSRRCDLKLVLMSATLNSEAFSSYFDDCPVVFIPGRTHPVSEHHLEDILELTGHEVQEDSDYALSTKASHRQKISKSALRKLYYPKYSKKTIHSLSIIDEEKINYPLVAELLEHITLTKDDGAILVFMPGMMEIQKTIEEMYKKEVFQSSKVAIYPLHSSLSTADQKAIFEVPLDGVRKIVVSTNIAETSITIEDVVYVVDSGRVKENRRDEINETPILLECYVSRASAKQRRGRAGRVKPGIAYHLFSTHTHDKILEDYQLPEMLRVGVEDLVLQILLLDLGEPTYFLSRALNPPSHLAMSNSLKLLETLGAVECHLHKAPCLAGQDNRNEGPPRDKTCGDLDIQCEMTALGFHLATLPVDPRVGKMMIYGSLFCCVKPALSIAASMSARSPFVSPFDQREEADQARKKFASDCSDHLTILNAFTKWQELVRIKGNKQMKSFLKEHFLGRLSLLQMQDLSKQFSSILKEIGFLKGVDSENANSTNVGLVKAVLCAGLYPNIIVAPRDLVSSFNSKKSAGEHSFRSHQKGDIHLHPSSIVFDKSRLDSRYCCFHEMVRTSKTYVRDCTTISPLAILLFGGKLEVFQAHGICSIDKWLKFQIDAKQATLIKYLRSQMERILFRKIVNPEEDVVNSSEGKALIRSISILFQRESEEQALIPDRSGGEIVRPWTGSDENEGSGPSNTGRRGLKGRGSGRGGRYSGRGSGTSERGPKRK